MNNYQCRSCGGPLNHIGDCYVCKFCGNKWEPEQENQPLNIDLINAWGTLREGDFESAAEQFEAVLVENGKLHEAHWGLALAQHGIIYVTDMNENKRVPTCNNITEDSFTGNTHVQTAISLAPGDIAASYRQQADYIEGVRREWLNKASKEPAYDVFISFKDSDRASGIERTQDSIDAQDLYNALVADGYKVFFSRISLRDKVSEQYEPYIYNAIRTAKVMVVFGEKPEYFRAVWVKNEWSRFKNRIEKGEKHKNSLVVAYKNMNPADLPAVLRSRQCLNAADMTFLSDLTRHVKRVIEESTKVGRLDRIQIQGGQVAKRSAQLSVNTIQTREIGQGMIAETDIDAKQKLSLVYTYIGAGMWEKAQALADDLLFSNPSYAEALWAKLLIERRVKQDKELGAQIQRLTDTEFTLMDRAIGSASAAFAKEKLDFLYQSCSQNAEAAYNKLLQKILPYQYANRQKRIDETFQWAIEKQWYSTFEILLKTLNADETDRYLSCNLQFERHTKNDELKEKCLHNILTVDEGNTEALRKKVHLDIRRYSDNIRLVIDDFEQLLRFTDRAHDEEFFPVFKGIIEGRLSPAKCELAKQLLRYHTGELSECERELLTLSYGAIRQRLYSDAEYFLQLILSFAPNHADVYWAFCLIRTGSCEDNDMVSSEILLHSLPEFEKYLVLVDETRRNKGLALAKAQVTARKAKKARKKKKWITISVLAAICVAITSFVSVIVYKKQHVKIPDGVTKITAATVSNWEKLKSISIPSSVTYIESDTFKNCTSLEDVYVSDLASFYAISYSSVGENPLLFADNLYLNGDLVEKWKIPDGATTIGYRTFSGCTQLTSIEIPNSVTSIEGEAFLDCTGLTNVIVPDSVETIGFKAFRGCSNLESMTIPFVGSRKDGDWLEWDYTSSDQLKLQDYFKYLFGQVENGYSVVPSGLKTVIVTGGVKLGSFYGESHLTTIILPESITKIGNLAFCYCRELENVNIPQSVTSIGQVAFGECEALTNIVIPDSVTSIEERAFSGCRNLISVTISKNLTSISSDVFENCNSLATIYYGSTESAWKEFNVTVPKVATVYFYSETQPTETGNYWRYVDGVATAW